MPLLMLGLLIYRFYVSFDKVPYDNSFCVVCSLHIYYLQNEMFCVYIHLIIRLVSIMSIYDSIVMLLLWFCEIIVL